MIPSFELKSFIVAKIICIAFHSDNKRTIVSQDLICDCEITSWSQVQELGIVIELIGIRICAFFLAYVNVKGMI